MQLWSSEEDQHAEDQAQRAEDRIQRAEQQAGHRLRIMNARAQNRTSLPKTVLSAQNSRPVTVCIQEQWPQCAAIVSRVVHVSLPVNGQGCSA